MSTFVTLAEVLEARGAPLDEDEVWSLLLGTVESLLGTSCKGAVNMCSIISPASLLLSATGNLAFRSCAWSEEMCSFTAPEVLQGRAITTRLAVEKQLDSRSGRLVALVVRAAAFGSKGHRLDVYLLSKVLIYSLGMTLYWSVDYQLPQNQPVQLSGHLNSLLLSMCEDTALRRADLLRVREACERHRKAALLLPASSVISQLVEDVLHDAVNHVSLLKNTSHLNHRSQAIRDRLHAGRRTPLSGFSDANSGSGESSGLSTDTETKQGRSHLASVWAHITKGLPPAIHQLSSRRMPCEPVQRDNECSCRTQNLYSSVPRHGNPGSSHLPGTSVRPQIKCLGPEFIRMLREPQITLEMPTPIVKGKACVAQADLSVIVPSGLSVLVKCDIKSRVGDVFDLVVAHTGLIEHFYFGLAIMENNEFFFLENEAKICKIASDCWKKAASVKFVLYLRIKFFVEDITFILHKVTQHQYYLQLRKDLVEDRLHCNEETALLLAALALQAEFGDYANEVCEKNYYEPEHYVSRSLMEKMALLCLRGELARLHASQSKLHPDEAEMEFLRVAQQLPDYGVLLHHVTQGKRPARGELMLGICSKGIIIYEVKNSSPVATHRFLWEETSSITSSRRKFSVKTNDGGKRHTFLTESTKTAKYLLFLCSTQHKFHKEMSSRHQSHSQLFEENILQFATECRAQCSHLQQLSRSHTVLSGTQAKISSRDCTGKSCEELPAPTKPLPAEQSDDQERNVKGDQHETKQQERLQPWSSSDLSPRRTSTVSLQNCNPEVLSFSSTSRADLLATMAEREVICLSLKKDPKLGLGIVIIGEDNIGELDLGIFIASVVPDGPVHKDGRIRPGSRLISLNKTSLEGVPFRVVADIMQSSPEEVELIVSQARRPWPQSTMESFLEKNFDSQAAVMGKYQTSVKELDEILSMTITPKARSRLQGRCSRSSSVVSFRPEEILFVKLRKTSGSLGICVAAGQRDGIFISSIIPGGAADQDGHLQIGDRLVEVDCVRLQGITYQQAVKTLMSAGEVVNLVVARESPAWSQMASPEVLLWNRGSSLAKDYSFVSDDNTLEVTLRKNHSGLGFSFLISQLDSTQGGGTAVQVKRLFPGQPAERCRLIREGDIILAINGEPLKGQSYQRVLDLIQSSPAKVRLSICRPSPSASMGTAALELCPIPH